MSNEIAKQVATNELTRRGFKVEPIPEGKKKTADLRVTGGNSKYLIEAKDRLETQKSTNAAKSASQRAKCSLTRIQLIMTTMYVRRSAKPESN